jgi:DNA-directed RNA polymerase subunit beta'
MLASNNVLSPANGEPIIVPSQDIVLGLYYATRERINAKGEGMSFADLAEVHRGYDSRQIELNARIWVRIREKEVADSGDVTEKITRYETTVGRALLSEILPVGLPFELLNKPLKKKEISRLINVGFRRCGLRETVIFADKLMQAGFSIATRAGISFGVHDMSIPAQKQELIKQAETEVKEIENQYTSGLVTAGERYNKVVDIWSRCGEQVGKVMMEQLGSEEVENRHGKKVKQEAFNSIYMMADSGARGSAAQIRQLAGMRGLMAKPDGSIIETPITANFREGLNVLQYFISTHGARKGLADTALKTANSGYLTRRLVDVTQDLVVTEDDCETTNGVSMKALVEGGEVVEALKERILGRVLATDLLHPETQDILYAAGTLLDEEAVDQIDNLGIDEVKVRTALSCDTRWGVCSKCYGRDLGRGSPVNVGEAIGVIAAQSIGEPGTQLTMRTFHIGGAASRTAVQSHVEAKSSGTVRFTSTMRYVSNAKGDKVVISRSGEVTIVDDNGRERERHKVPYGAQLLAADGDAVRAGKQLAAWDPHHRPIITEYAGTVKFEHVEEGATVAKQIDDVTGLSTLVVIDAKRRTTATGKGQRPSVKLINEAGEEVRIAGTDHAVNISFPVGAVIAVRDGQQVQVGEVLARIPQEVSKTRDITGGLPRVAELFEARSPKDAGMLAEVTGTVSFGKDTKGKQRLVITDLDKQEHEYLIAKPARRGGARALHHRRGAGRLPPAGREDQRQAHRGHRAPDAAARGDHRSGRNHVHHRRAGRARRSARGEREGREGRQEAGGVRLHAARHHQGLALDRLVHLRGLVPGDDASPHRGGDHGQARRPARPEGERDRRAPHPGGNRPRVPQYPQGPGRRAGARRDRDGCSGSPARRDHRDRRRRQLTKIGVRARFPRKGRLRAPFPLVHGIDTPDQRRVACFAGTKKTPRGEHGHASSRAHCRSHEVLAKTLLAELVLDD